MARLLLKRDASESPHLTQPTPLGWTAFPLTKQETVLGRQSDSDVRLPTLYVARQEARIVREDNGFFLENIGSVSATVVHGEMLWQHPDKVPLRDGDEIQVGQYLFVFEERDSEP